MKKIPNLNYFAAAGLVTVIMLVIYAGIQQAYRTGLDDPQIQMVTEASRKIEQGKPVDKIISEDPIDIASNLSPFIILYNASGKPTYSNALLDGKMPDLPGGLLDAANKKAEYRVTWQPNKAVRMAMVIKKINVTPVQFVAAGRSMRETERRIAAWQEMAFFGWTICIGIIVLTAALNYFMSANQILQKQN